MNKFKLDIINISEDRLNKTILVNKLRQWQLEKIEIKDWYIEVIYLWKNWYDIKLRDMKNNMIAEAKRKYKYEIIKFCKQIWTERYKNNNFYTYISNTESYSKIYISKTKNNDCIFEIKNLDNNKNIMYTNFEQAEYFTFNSNYNCYRVHNWDIDNINTKTLEAYLK